MNSWAVDLAALFPLELVVTSDEKFHEQDNRELIHLLSIQKRIRKTIKQSRAKSATKPEQGNRKVAGVRNRASI
jgi:hypothetical protein